MCALQSNANSCMPSAPLACSGSPPRCCKHLPSIYLPYGRKFWRGIYFGGLAVLRAIRQYFIRQIAAQCDVIIIAKSYQCVYTRPAARRASLIVVIEFTIKSCVRGHHFSKEFCTPEVEEELACLSRRRRRSKRRVRGPVNTDGTKIVQSKRNSDLLSFHLHFIINFVLTEPKLTHGPIIIPARLSNHFVGASLSEPHMYE